MMVTGVEQLDVLPAWMQVALVLSCSIVAAKVVELLGYAVLHRSRTLASEEYDRTIIEEVHVPLYVTVLLAGVYVSARLLPQVTVGFYISSSAISIILVVWAYAIVRLGNRIIENTNSSPSAREITPIFKNMLTFTVVLISFVLFLSIWRVDVTPLLASAGVLGLVLGIAARDSIGNFFGGISLYLDKTYKIGDVIQVESGERGTVVDMSIRSTTILTRDNIAITIPNAEMNSTQVINESAPIRRRRIRLNVGVAYGSDLETVKTALLDVAEEEPLILESPRPVVRFREFADSAVVAQLQCHIDNPAMMGRAHHVLIERIDARFAADDVKIPFPQREVTFFEAGNSISIAEDTSSGEDQHIEELSRRNR